MEPTTMFELRLAGRMSRLGTETAFEVLNRARALEKQGKEIIHLEIGEPDFDTPPNVVEAGIEALRKGWTHYGPSAGLPELRQAIADYVSRTRKVPVSSDEVVVVPGGKPIIFFTILALIESGDEVLYPNPGFPIYESMVNYSVGKGIPIPLREERDFSVDVKELASLITDNTRLIILNSPHNPTGGILTKKDILEIAEAIGDRNILVLSDEIYSRLIYDGEHFSIMSVPGFSTPQQVVLLQSRGRFDGGVTRSTGKYHSAYVNDSWAMGKHATLNVGLRWEQQRMTGNVASKLFNDMWSPRVGFIVDPKGDRKSKIYANYGRYAFVLPLDAAVEVEMIVEVA